MEYLSRKNNNLTKYTQKSYEDRIDNISAQKELKDLQEMRKALGMKQLEKVMRNCLRCNKQFSTFRLSGVHMCSTCRKCNDAKTENFTY